MEALTRRFREAALRALHWSEQTAETLVQRPIKQILLLHVGAFDALALGDLLSAYEERGVLFIPVQEALGDPVYGIDPKVTGRGQENFLTQLLRAPAGLVLGRWSRPEGCHTD